MDTLVPRVSVFLGGKHLDDWGLTPFLKAVTCSRSIDRTDWTATSIKGRQRRDTATLTFDNLDNQIARWVAINELVEIHMGYGNDMYHRGTYTVREPTFRYPQDGGLVITLACEDKSADLMATRVGRQFLNPTIENIVARIAGDRGFDHDVHESLKDVVLPSMISDSTESDWEFLERLTLMTGIGMFWLEPPATATDNFTLKVMPLGFKGQYGQHGAEEDSKLLTLGYKDPDADVFVNEVVVTMDAEAGALTAKDVDDHGKLMLMHDTATGDQVVVRMRRDAPLGSDTDGESIDRTAKGKAVVLPGATAYIPDGVLTMEELTSSVSSWRAFKIKITLKIKPGAPFLYPGRVARLTGVIPFSGKVAIMKVIDNYDGSYGQTVECRTSTILDNIEDSAFSAGRLTTVTDTITGESVVVNNTKDSAATDEGSGVGE